MPMGVGGPGVSNPPVQPAAGSLWSFLNGAWQATSLATFLASSPLVDATTFVVGDLDPTKRITFQADTQATASTLTIDVGAQTASRTLTVPVMTGNRTLAVIDQAQTFSALQTFGAGLTTSSGVATAVLGGGFKITGEPVSFTGNGIEFSFVTASNTASIACYDRGASAYRAMNFNALSVVWQTSGGTVAGFNAAATATSSLTGNLVVGDLVTAATCVGIGGGNINAGGTLSVAGIGAIGGATNAGCILSVANGTNPLTVANQVAIFTPGSFVGTSSATGSIRGMQFNVATAAAAFTCAEITTINCGAYSAGAGSTITRGYGLRIAASAAASTANIGIAYGSSLTETGTWFIYDSGSSPSRFGASVLLGTTTDGMTAGGSIAIAQDFAHRGTKFGAFNATPTTQSTGYGTPTGGAKLINFPGATATLAQTSGALAQLLLDLKAYGLLGA